MENGTWTKIKVICNNAENKPDCEGCGMNTVKDGFLWQLDTRIPCSNSKNRIVNFMEVK
jgi:hypothetical protein